MIKIYCDSSIREACIFFDPPVLNQPKFQVISYQADSITTNEGEYLAVLAALDLVRSYSLTDFVLLTDSQLVTKQVSNEYACHNPTLAMLCRRVQDALSEFPAQVTLSWIPREENLAGKELEKIYNERRKKSNKGG